MFPAQTYLDRRASLKSRFGSGLLLFLGNEESPMNYLDNGYPFRQDSSFLYFFGIDQPGYAAVIDLDEGTTTVFGNDLTIDDIVWTGVLPTVAELALRGGVTTTAPVSALEACLRKAGGRQIHFLPPYRPEHRLKLFKLLGVHPDAQDERASLELKKAIIDLRVHKSPEEIAELEHARRCHRGHAPGGHAHGEAGGD